jgi:hypothetical protein
MLNTTSAEDSICIEHTLNMQKEYKALLQLRKEKDKVKSHENISVLQSNMAMTAIPESETTTITHNSPMKHRYKQSYHILPLATTDKNVTENTENIDH